MNTPTALHTLWAFLSDAPILGRLFLASIEMPILAVLVWLSIRAGLVQSPRWRALLWLIVLVKPLTVLAIGSFVPVIRIAPTTLPPTDIPAPITVTNPIQTPHSDLSPSSTVSTPPQPIFDSPPAVTPPPSQPGFTPRNILQAWLLGLGLMGAYSLLDRIRLYRLLFHATPIAADSAAPADLSVRYRELAARLNLKRVPRLFLTNTLESPALAGTIRPVILLPAWLGHEGWTPSWNGHCATS